MYYESLLEKLLDENNDEIIELQPDGGEKVKFEQIAVVRYETKLYAILRPLELKEEQVVGFRLDEDDEENLELVTDENIAKKVLEVYENDNDEEDEE